MEYVSCGCLSDGRGRVGNGQIYSQHPFEPRPHLSGHRHLLYGSTLGQDVSVYHAALAPTVHSTLETTITTPHCYRYVKHHYPVHPLFRAICGLQSGLSSPVAPRLPVSPGLFLPYFYPVPPSRITLPSPGCEFRVPAPGMTWSTSGRAPSPHRPPLVVNFRTFPRRQGDIPGPDQTHTNC
jgi:hypothetical protein